MLIDEVRTKSNSSTSTLFNPSLVASTIQRCTFLKKSQFFKLKQKRTENNIKISKPELIVIKEGLMIRNIVFSLKIC